MSWTKQAFWPFVLAVCTANAAAQDLEPRSYSRTPVGLNFLVAGYAYTDGNVAFDPAVQLTNAHLHTNSMIYAYARALDAWGRSAKFDVILPYTWLAGSALFVGQPRTREVSGPGDPRFRVSVDLLGAPAQSIKEFVPSKGNELVVGASLQISAPWGQYDASKLVNLGTNRWSFKPELGLSKQWGSWIFELAPSATFFTDNTDFLKGRTLAQAPIYAVQGHVVHTFRSGIWAALDSTYYWGARTTVNGVAGDTLQRNSRAGATFSLPIDRYSSVKFYGSTGTSSRTGASYNLVGAAWQYRWGSGF